MESPSSSSGTKEAKMGGQLARNESMQYFIGCAMWGRDLVMVFEMSQKFGLYPQ